MSLLTTLSSTPTKELLRAYNSDKGYLYFDISVFNVGASINIKCTDTFKQINRNTWNGYDFFIENDNTTKYYILQEFRNRIKDPENILTPTQTKRVKAIINANL